MSIATLGLALIATLIVSTVSFVGLFFISLLERVETFNKLLLSLVGLSSGALFGGAFLHLFPEAIEEVGAEIIPISIALLSAITVFCLRKIPSLAALSQRTLRSSYFYLHELTW